MDTDTQAEFDLDTALEQWHVAKQAAIAAKAVIENEQALRKSIFAHVFDQNIRGQQAKKIGHDMALVAKGKLSFSVDRPALEAALQIENMRPLIESVISFTPSVRDAAFDGLSHDDKIAFAEILTVKPGMPDLEIKPAKGIRKFTA